MFGFLALALLAIGLVLTGKERRRQMTPAEEAQYELHPVLRPEPAFITPANVGDVIAETLETGVEPRCLRSLKDAQAIPENPETTRRGRK
jgi:hypothetical protein